MRPVVAFRNALFLVLFVVMLLYMYMAHISLPIDFEPASTSILAHSPPKVDGDHSMADKVVEQVGTAVVREEIVVTPEVVAFMEDKAPADIVQPPVETMVQEKVAQVTAALVDPLSVLETTSIEDLESSIPTDEIFSDGLPKRIGNMEITDPELESFIASEPEEDFEVMSGTTAAEYPPQGRPYISVGGFRFCDILDNSTFFTDVDIQIPGIEGTLNDQNARKFIEYIDWSAQQMLAHPEYQTYFQRETEYTKGVTTDSLKRGICWNVAQGNLLWWKPYVKFDQNLNDKYNGRVLRTIDATATFPFLNYDGNQIARPLPNSTSKPHYRLAYVVMVHSNAENVAALIDALADPTVFIYLHVDLAADEAFHQQMRDLVRNRYHIYLTPNPLSVSWSHVSLIWVEIRAFFDLLDLINFEYVINLSGADYPLKSANTIYRHLEKKPGSNWIWWSTGGKNTWELNHRWHNMFHCREYRGAWERRCVFTPETHGYREFDGYTQLFPHLYKTSQWLILHRSSVEYLRSSEAGKLLLMHSEHTLMPDEMFFSTFFAQTPFNNRTFRDPKRLMFWNGGSHPWEWTMPDEAVIRTWAKHFLWIRKVDVTANSELKGVLDDVRKKDKMSNRIVLKYKGGIIPVD